MDPEDLEEIRRIRAMVDADGADGREALNEADLADLALGYTMKTVAELKAECTERNILFMVEGKKKADYIKALKDDDEGKVRDGGLWAGLADRMVAQKAQIDEYKDHIKKANDQSDVLEAKYRSVIDLLKAVPNKTPENYDKIFQCYENLIKLAKLRGNIVGIGEGLAGMEL